MLIERKLKTFGIIGLSYALLSLDQTGGVWKRGGVLRSSLFPYFIFKRPILKWLFIYFNQKIPPFLAAHLSSEGIDLTKN